MFYVVGTLLNFFQNHIFIQNHIFLYYKYASYSWYTTNFKIVQNHIYISCLKIANYSNNFITTQLPEKYIIKNYIGHTSISLDFSS